MNKILQIRTQEGEVIYEPALHILNTPYLQKFNCAPLATNITRLSQNINTKGCDSGSVITDESILKDTNYLRFLADMTIEMH